MDVTELEAGAPELYRGICGRAVLAGCLRFEEWLLFERAAVAWKIPGGSGNRQLESKEMQGDLSAVVITAQQLLKLENLREDWHSALIETYARLGKRSTALGQYVVISPGIRAEWGMEPSPETVALALAIRCGENGH